MLKQYLEEAEKQSDENFNAAFDGYFFAGDIGYGSDNVELCEGGFEKPLRRENVHEFVKLYLQKYTEQENL